MPIYDYKCGSCGNIQVAIKRMDDRHSTELDDCQSCGKVGTMSLTMLTVAGLNYQASDKNKAKTTDNFNSRLQKMSENRGKGCTISYRRSPI